MSQAHVLMVGDWQTSEFAPAAALTRSLCRVTELADLCEAVRWFAERDGSADLMLPDLVAIALAYPGQFSTVALETLRAQAPLTPVVAITGAWCDGEQRTGAPWPGVVRVAWHQWADRFPTEAAALAAGRSSAWALPHTATPDERLLFSAAATSKATNLPPRSPGLVAIVCDHHETVDWLMGVCRARGWPAVCLPRWEAASPSAATGEHAATTHTPSIALEGVGVVVWDVGSINSETIAAWERMAPLFHGAAVLALVGFPRPDDVRRLVAAGVAAVMAKPLSTGELCRRMVELATPR